MNSFVSLVAAFGLGGIIVKLIDVFILQRFLKKDNLDNWLREKRYVAYLEAIENLISFGLNVEDDSPFNHLGSLSKALLLIDDEHLHDKLQLHIFNRNDLNKMSDNEPDSKEFGVLFTRVNAEAKELILALKADLRGKPNK